MLNIKHLALTLTMLTTLLSGNVHAAPVSFTALGDVQTADAGNDFGLTTAIDINASGTFNDAGFTGTGIETFNTTLSLTGGSLNYSEADSTVTEIVFEDGLFLGFNFFTGSFGGPDGFFDSTADFFNGEDKDFLYVDGVWGNYQVVPVPAAAWLFGSGLLGLVGLARRKAA